MYTSGLLRRLQQWTNQLSKIFITKYKGHNSMLTFLDQSSKSSCVLSLFLKLSPSALSFWPSTWLSQPLPSTSSTRRRYAVNWRSIYTNKATTEEWNVEMFVKLKFKQLPLDNNKCSKELRSLKYACIKSSKVKKFVKSLNLNGAFKQQHVYTFFQTDIFNIISTDQLNVVIKIWWLSRFYRIWIVTLQIDKCQSLVFKTHLNYDVHLILNKI